MSDANNIIKFTGNFEREPDFVHKENKLGMVEDLSAEWVMEVVDKLHVMGIPISDDEAVHADLCLIMEAFQSLLGRPANLTHPLQKFSELVFSKDPSKIKTVKEMVELYYEQYTK